MALPHLNRALVLEAPERAPDGAGGFIDTWVVLGTLWADVKPGTGRERSEGPAPISAVALHIVVRAAPEGSSARPKPGQRLREGGRIYAISAVREWDAQARYLTCFATEEVAP